MSIIPIYCVYNTIHWRAQPMLDFKSGEEIN